MNENDDINNYIPSLLNPRTIRNENISLTQVSFEYQNTSKFSIIYTLFLIHTNKFKFNPTFTKKMIRFATKIL